MALALAIVVLQIAWVLSVDIRLGSYFPQWSWLPLRFSLALGPLFYFYVLKLTRPQYNFRLKDLLHFSSLLLELGAHGLEIKESIKTGAATYDTLTFYYVNPVLQVLVFFSVIIYLYYSFKLIERFYRRLKFNDVSDRYRYELRWLHRSLTGFSLLWLLWIPFTAVNYFYYHESGMHSYYALYLLLAIMMIRIAAAAFLKPDVGMPAPAPPVSKLSAPAELKQKGIWLKKTMEVNLFYQDAELSLRSLAEALNLTPNELSRIINTALGKNFNDFINEYRIREVTRKMQDPAYDRITLIGIAMDAGFNSKSTFNRTFRQMTGKSPAEYKSRLEKERPTYTLRPYYRSAAIISYNEAAPRWSSEKLNRNFMFRNYLKIAWRSLLMNKVHTFINVAGLSVGMAVALLIGLWTYDELSFDHYHRHYDRIGQIMTTQTSGAQTVTFGATVVPLAVELRNRYADNFTAVVLTANGKHILAAGETKLAQEGIFAEPGLPALLSLKMLKGSYSGFSDPSAMFLSASTAKALFGQADPINKIVRIDNYKDLKVAGIYQDLPANSTYNTARYLLPWRSPFNAWYMHQPKWDNHGVQLLVQLKQDFEFDRVSAQIKNITTPYNKNLNETIQLFPMAKWHLYSQFENGKSVGGRIQLVRLFSIIGLFVLLLACINFMNLSTAQSEKKAKQVGIRKAIGSLRSQLVAQFLSESIVMVCLAFVLALAILWVCLPYFNLLAGKQVVLPWGNPLFWLLIICFILITGLLAGSYPAFYLSGFHPIKVLKGTFKAGRFVAIPRKILVVAQFTVSIVLIIGTIVVFRQIQFAMNRSAGYIRNGLITIEMNTPQIYGHYEAMRNDLIATRGALDMAESSNATTELGITNTGFNWDGKPPGFDPTFGNVFVSPDFGKTIGWQIIEGRDFSRDNPSDTGAFILNESALKLTGIKRPIGKTMFWFGKYHVITGIVKDLVMESPYMPIKATVFQMKPDWVNRITVRLNNNIAIPEAIRKIEPVFKRFNPGSPFEFKFNDDEYAKKFSDEQRAGRLAMIFAVLAIMISCLGMFGMASFTAERRVKEIGVRKVLGASVFTLWRLLSAESVGLVLISLLIAVPAGWFFMHSWLQNYPYRTPIAWWIFGLTGLAAILITLATVSYQSIKAALTNPVKSLRSE